MDYKIYLAKEGKTHGPFTPEEFERIRSSGQITGYDAIFDGRNGSWQPLDVPPAPAAPLTAAAAEPARVDGEKVAPIASARSARTAVAPAPASARAPARSASLAVRAVEAVCHNYRTVVAGRLSRVTETGCDLVSGTRDAGPCFAERGQVFLNLLDPQTGKAMDVAAQLTAVTRAPDGSWTYRLEWPSCPEILLAA